MHHIHEYSAFFYKFFWLDKVRKDTLEGGTLPNPWRDGPSLLKSPGKSNLLELLGMGTRSGATDPRDHIYGLLGLANCKTQVDIGISPDYTKSTSLVFREAFKAAVEIENNLEVLRLRNYLPCSSMPSWAPDFARPASLYYPSLALTDGIHHLSACGGRSLRYQLSSNLEVLTIQGVPVDMIERVMELREFDEEPSICIYKGHEMATSTTNQDPRPLPGTSP
jgi:hypothetical protein